MPTAPLAPVTEASACHQQTQWEPQCTKMLLLPDAQEPQNIKQYLGVC